MAFVVVLLQEAITGKGTQWEEGGGAQRLARALVTVLRPVARLARERERHPHQPVN